MIYPSYAQANRPTTTATRTICATVVAVAEPDCSARTRPVTSKFGDFSGFPSSANSNDLQIREPAMRMSRVCLVLAFVSGVAAGTNAHAEEESVVKLPNDILFKAPRVSPGPETAVLYGDPSKPGVYVMRVKFPAGFKLMPLWHPDEWRTAVVLSGTLYFGVGDQWDETKLKAFPAGTFYSGFSKAPHFAWAKDGEAIVQFTAAGPTGITRIPQK
jgi:hypothetical protein